MMIHAVLYTAVTAVANACWNRQCEQSQLSSVEPEHAGRRRDGSASEQPLCVIHVGLLSFNGSWVHDVEEGHRHECKQSHD